MRKKGWRICNNAIAGIEDAPLQPPRKPPSKTRIHHDTADITHLVVHESSAIEYPFGKERNQGTIEHTRVVDVGATQRPTRAPKAAEDTERMKSTVQVFFVWHMP
jgi:hypothetical protein